VITENCNSKIIFDFLYYFLFIHIYCIFFLILEKDFLFCMKKAKKIEKYERLVGNIDNSNVLLRICIIDTSRGHSTEQNHKIVDIARNRTTKS